jgi:putative copper resistance protein D
MPVLCAGLLVSLAGVGHTQINDGAAWFIHVSADSLHLLAAGAWLGGLVSLFYLVGPAVGKSPAGDVEATHAALRFSAMGYIAVAASTGSGLLNSWYLVGSSANLATPYGQLLIVKMGLFGAMIGIAGLNRFWIVPRLIDAHGIGGRSAGLAKLRRHIVGEQALGILIVLIVGVLGTMQPAINPS